MSWSLYIPAPADDFEVAAAKAVTEHAEQLAAANNEISEEANAQIVAAVAAAAVLIESGAVGAYLQVSLAGHANPEHKPQQGWSNDTISVTVAQATPVESP